MTDVAAGTYSSFAVSADGRVEAWGLNNYGQLGMPATTSAHHTPNVVSALADHSIAAVAGGQHHTLAVTAVSGWLVE
jgi:regulator of chromosome condensation